jgi:LPS-assembly protein
VAVVAALQRLSAFPRRATVRREQLRLATARLPLALILVVLAAGVLDLMTISPAAAQAFTYNPRPPHAQPPKVASDGQMLVQAVEVDYDYNNSRVSAVGNVQLFYNGTSVEADKVVYDQKTKRLYAEGNIRLTDADGKVTYANTLDLSDDYRDGFVDSLRVDTAPAATTRFSRTASIRPAHPAGTIRRSRRSGRSRARASSTTNPRRCSTSRPRSSNSSGCRWPICRTSQRPIRR